MNSDKNRNVYQQYGNYGTVMRHLLTATLNELVQ